MQNDAANVSLLKVWAQPKILVLLFLGFSSGLPLYLTSRTLQAWMTAENVSLSTVGAFSLVALPYSLKFLWAPLMDRYVPPFLGRRRGWLVVTQLLLFAAIAAMSLHNPRTALQMVALNAVLVAFFSASQDIVVDAYRTDVLEDRERGAGAAIAVLGYRVALLVTAALAFMLADSLSWPMVYVLMSLLMIVGVAATLLAPEPQRAVTPPATLADAVVLPFRDFLRRFGAARLVYVLLFIVLYRYPDSLATNMTTPFLLNIGFTAGEIGAILGGIGIAATIVGALAGGSVVAKLGLFRSLWVFGVLQAISNLAYFGLANAGPNQALFVGTVLVENFCGGLVAAGFVAFLMSLCNASFSATQYALLSSLMAASRDVLVSGAGSLAEQTGWPLFFLITIVAAVPGMVMLAVFAPWRGDTRA
jgi:PAT family beta-lactamase induction signal transducer AmpG